MVWIYCRGVRGIGTAPKLKIFRLCFCRKWVGKMCLQTLSSIVELKWIVEFLMSACFYLPAVSSSGDWLQSWQSAWERGSASSGSIPVHRPAAPPVSGEGTLISIDSWLALADWNRFINLALMIMSNRQCWGPVFIPPPFQSATWGSVCVQGYKRSYKNI